MKALHYILTGALATGLVMACNEGIDSISRVDPGPDEENPVIEITYPAEDVFIPFTEEETSINFKFEVEDDIEIGSVTISLNEEELASFNNFKDYRRAIESYLYEGLPVGEHTVKVIATDLSGKSSTETFTFEVSNKYIAKYDGEVFYMPFEGQLYTELISETNPTVVGGPGFAGEGAVGLEAYAGATDAYLTFPIAGLLSDEFSATCWVKVNTSAAKAGILVIGPPDEAHPTDMNDRTKGFRLFREGSETSQVFKLNVGTGAGEAWFDGGAAATINPTTNTGWLHIAFTISATECKLYFDGEVVSEGTFTGVDWTGCDILSIASGAPRFTEWGHLSEEGFIDDIRLYNKALSQAEVQATM